METDFLIKITITGDGGVGKTTLLHYYSYGVFRANLEMTIGVQFFQKTVNIHNKAYKIIFWDLGGEDQFRQLHKLYLEGSMGAIYMFDLSMLSTLQSVGEWTNILRKKNGDIPILLVGSKYDLIEKDKERIKQINDHAIKIKEQYNLFDYIITSSKIGYNIDHAFLILLEKIRNYHVMKQILDKLKQPVQF